VDEKTRPAPVKTWQCESLKLDAAGEGTFVAVFATLEAWDHDGDWTERGAIGRQKVVISQWNHGSWERGVAGLPLGIGEIHEDGNKAIVEGSFDLGDEDAIRTYRKLKYLKDNGRAVEWSYALPEVQWAMGEREGRMGRIIQKVKVPEVSPVLLGAGVDTELLSIKGKEQPKPAQTTEQAPAKKTITRIEDALEAVNDVTRRVAKALSRREAEGKGKRLSKSATEQLEKLRAGLREAVKAVDALLAAPDAREVSSVLRSIEAAHEERKRSWH